MISVNICSRAFQIFHSVKNIFKMELFYNPGTVHLLPKDIVKISWYCKIKMITSYISEDNLEIHTIILIERKRNELNLCFSQFFGKIQEMFLIVWFIKFMRKSRIPKFQQLKPTKISTELQTKGNHSRSAISWWDFDGISEFLFVGILTWRNFSLSGLCLCFLDFSLEELKNFNNDYIWSIVLSIINVILLF